MFASWTHIKFYTFYSLKKELNACGYKVIWQGGAPELIDCSKMKLRAKIFFGIFNLFLKLSKFLVKILPSLFSQHIIVVVRKDRDIDKEYLRRYEAYICLEQI
jgi:hypothetical protein